MDAAVKVSILSFSYMRDIPEDRTGHGGGFVFDCRGLPNPFWEEGLRLFSGRDAEVEAFFARHREAVVAFAGAVEALVRQTIQTFQSDGRRHIQVAFGCTGGQHRSVFMAEELARRLRGVSGVETEVVHTAAEYWDKPTSPPLFKPAPKSKADTSSNYRLTPSEIESMRQHFKRGRAYLGNFKDLFK